VAFLVGVILAVLAAVALVVIVTTHHCFYLLGLGL
jgi:hypothetical protein